MKDFCEEIQTPVSNGTHNKKPGWFINKPNAISAAKGSIAVTGSSNKKDQIRHSGGRYSALSGKLDVYKAVKSPMAAKPNKIQPSGSLKPDSPEMVLPQSVNRRASQAKD